MKGRERLQNDYVLQGNLNTRFWPRYQNKRMTECADVFTNCVFKFLRIQRRNIMQFYLVKWPFVDETLVY